MKGSWHPGDYSKNFFVIKINIYHDFISLMKLYIKNVQPFSKCIDEMKQESKSIKIDRRLTGAYIIDEPLQQVSFLNILFTIIICTIFYYLRVKAFSNLFYVVGK